jgi:hypothetical protein
LLADTGEMNVLAVDDDFAIREALTARCGPTATTSSSRATGRRRPSGIRMPLQPGCARTGGRRSLTTEQQPRERSSDDEDQRRRAAARRQVRVRRRQLSGPPMPSSTRATVTARTAAPAPVRRSSRSWASSWRGSRLRKVRTGSSSGRGRREPHALWGVRLPALLRRARGGVRARRHGVAEGRAEHPADRPSTSSSAPRRPGSRSPTTWPRTRSTSVTPIRRRNKGEGDEESDHLPRDWR